MKVFFLLISCVATEYTSFQYRANSGSGGPPEEGFRYQLADVFTNMGVSVTVNSWNVIESENTQGLNVFRVDIGPEGHLNASEVLDFFHECSPRYRIEHSLQNSFSMKNAEILKACVADQIGVGCVAETPDLPSCAANTTGDSESESDDGVIIIVVILVLVFLVVIAAILICWCCFVRNRDKNRPREVWGLPGLFPPSAARTGYAGPTTGLHELPSLKFGGE